MAICSLLANLFLLDTRGLLKMDEAIIFGEGVINGW
jgi:hypothetical protein